MYVCVLHIEHAGVNFKKTRVQRFSSTLRILIFTRVDGGKKKNEKLFLKSNFIEKCCDKV